jgi:hypothetical protein
VFVRTGELNKPELLKNINEKLINLECSLSIKRSVFGTGKFEYSDAEYLTAVQEIYTEYINGEALFSTYLDAWMEFQVINRKCILEVSNDEVGRKLLDGLNKIDADNVSVVPGFDDSVKLAEVKINKFSLDKNIGTAFIDGMRCIQNKALFNKRKNISREKYENYSKNLDSFFENVMHERESVDFFYLNKTDWVVTIKEYSNHELRNFINGLYNYIKDIHNEVSVEEYAAIIDILRDLVIFKRSKIYWSFSSDFVEKSINLILERVPTYNKK